MTNDFIADLLHNQVLTRNNCLKSDDQYYEDLGNLRPEHPIYAPNYEVVFKRPIYPIRIYFHRCISIETILIFNKIYRVFTNKDFDQEYYIQYHKFHEFLSDILIHIRNYIAKNNISPELYLNPEYDIRSDQAYIVYYLKANIIMLLMEIQDKFGQFSTTDVLNIEEIYEFYFNERPPEEPLIVTSKKKSHPTKKIIKSQGLNKKDSFGYRSQNKDDLLIVLKKLQLRIDLINDSFSSIQDLHKLLLSKDFKLEETSIHLSCETTQFSYIVRQLKPYFIRFNPTMVEKSGKFYSKKGILIKKSNLYKNSVDNTKEKVEIDKIIKQLQ